MNPFDLTEAIMILRTARTSVYGTSDFAWNKLLNAHQHLEKQMQAYFAPEEIKEAA